MNDDELMTAVRDSFTGVRSATPVDQIVRRSRTVRTRRRIPALAGALVVTAAGAIAMTMLLADHQPSHPGTAQLTAWTVTKHADGTISVTIRELRDPAGLQHTLRADGLPTSVTFFGQQNPACVPYPHRRGQSRSETRRMTIIKGLFTGRYSSGTIVRPAASGGGLIIDPSALPSGVGLQIGAGPVRHFSRISLSPIWAGLVEASQQCTGSPSG
jgi:hypothetical protein